MNISWLLKTIGIGIIPLLIRVIACLLFGLTKDASVWYPVDFIFFGLTVGLSCILQISSLKSSTSSWKLVNSFLIWIIILIVLLAFELGVVYVDEMIPESLINKSVAIVMALVLVGVTLCMAGVFVYKIQKTK